MRLEKAGGEAEEEATDRQLVMQGYFEWDGLVLLGEAAEV